MTIEQIINNNFKNLEWDNTTQAYYRLDFTPFMEIIYNSAKEYAHLMCEKQKEICADNAEADWDYEEHYEDEREVNMFGGITSYVLKQSILKCKNATEI